MRLKGTQVSLDFGVLCRLVEVHHDFSPDATLRLNHDRPHLEDVRQVHVLAICFLFVVLAHETSNELDLSLNSHLRQFRLDDKLKLFVQLFRSGVDRQVGFN